MPDLITIANELKGVPDQALATEMQNPTGGVPPYLVMAELQRRQLLRSGSQGQQAAQQGQSTVAQDTLRNTIQSLMQQQPPGPPAPPGMTPVSMRQPAAGMATPVPGTTPPANFRMPPRMQEGGLVDYSTAGQGQTGYGDPDDPNSVANYLRALQRKAMWSSGSLMPGLARGGSVDDDGDDDEDEEGNGGEEEQEEEEPAAEEDEEEEPYYAPTAGFVSASPPTPPQTLPPPKAPPPQESILQRIERVPSMLRGSINHLIEESAKRYNIPSKLVRTVAHMESRGNPNARSPAGAVGVMQLMPGTAAQYGVHDRRDAAQNIDAGAHYLSDLLKRYKGNLSHTLAAYNAGPGNVDRYGGVPPFRETQHYVNSGLAFYAMPGFQKGGEVKDKDKDAAASTGDGDNTDGGGGMNLADVLPIGTDPFSQYYSGIRDQAGLGPGPPPDLLAATQPPPPLTASAAPPPTPTPTPAPAPAPAPAPTAFEPAAPGEPPPPEEPAKVEKPADIGKGMIAGNVPIPSLAIPDPLGEMPSPDQMTIPSGDPRVEDLTADAPQDVVDRQKDLVDSLKNNYSQQDMYKLVSSSLKNYLHPPNDAAARASIQSFQDQIQKNLHPSISSVLLRMGLGLLASHSPFFGVALGEAGLGAMASMEKQQEEAKKQWLDSIKMGTELEDKRRQYETTLATLTQSGVNAWGTNQTKQVDDRLKAYEKALENWQKDPGVQTQHRFEIINAARVKNGLEPYTSILDPRFASDNPGIQNWVMGGKGTTTKAGAISPTVTVTKDILPWVKDVTNPHTNQPYKEGDKATEAELGKGYQGFIRKEGAASKTLTPEEIEANAKEIAPIELGDAYDDSKPAFPQLSLEMREKAKLPMEKWGPLENLSERSYQSAARRLDTRSKPLEDRLKQLGDLKTMLDQGTPLSDSMLAPKLLSFTVGGQGSGLRMNEAEIKRVVGGATVWTNLQRELNRFRTDPNAPQLPVAMRNQVRTLIGAMEDRLTARRNALLAATQDLGTTQDRMKHRAIEHAGNTALAAIDDAAGGKVHLMANKVGYDVPMNEVYGFLRRHSQEKIELGKYHHFVAPGQTGWLIPEEELSKRVPELKKQYPQAVDLGT